MQTRDRIAMKDFNPDIFRLFDDQWALVTAGTKENFNSMTISWGMLGSLWGDAKKGKNVCTVFIKPARYTHQFIEDNDYFTVSFYDDAKYLKALGVMGSQSGRDIDKVAETGLTPKFLNKGVTYEEATTTLVLRKIYSHDFDKTKIPADVVEHFYATDSLADKPHTMYIGEVVEMIRK